MGILNVNRNDLNIVHKDYKKLKIITAILFVLGALLLCSFLLSVSGICAYGVIMGLKCAWTFLIGCNWWLIFSVTLGIFSLTIGLFILGLCLVFGLSGIIIFISSFTAFNHINDESRGY